METNTTTTTEIIANTRAINPQETARQIGTMNLMAISGGRVGTVVNERNEYAAIDLPVSSGYRVVVTLAADDTYTVHRVMKRGAKLFAKGTVAGVYCDQVGEIAYQASCYRNVEFGRWAF